MIEAVQTLQHRSFDQRAEQPRRQRYQEQRPPVAETEILQQKPSDEGAQHVKGAVREVDDVEQPEDDGEAEAEHGVERAVDQPQHHLAEQRACGGTPSSSNICLLDAFTASFRSPLTALRASLSPSERVGVRV